MKKPFATLAVLLFTASFGCYGQEKKPVKTQPPPDAPKQIEIKDEWGDLSIDAPPRSTSPEQDENAIYENSSVQVSPEFPGGVKAFLEYINKNINKDAFTEDTPDGSYKVFASFVVEKDGNLTDIKILREPGYGIGPEVYKTIRAMGRKWSPGIVNGKPVRVRYILQIIVKLP